jgi:hypothetical protein
MNWPWPLSASALLGGGGIEETHAQTVSSVLAQGVVGSSQLFMSSDGAVQLAAPGARQSPRRKRPVREEMA